MKGEKKKKKKERKKERIPSEQPRVSDPLMVVDTQSYAVSDVPLKKKKKTNKYSASKQVTNTVQVSK